MCTGILYSGDYADLIDDFFLKLSRKYGYQKVNYRSSFLNQ